jgi:hypothetical protein
MKYDFISWDGKKGEKEGKEEKQPPSLRYLATEILFKGYCIIFLMRFSLYNTIFFHHFILLLSLQLLTHLIHVERRLEENYAINTAMS